MVNLFCKGVIPKYEKMKINQYIDHTILKPTVLLQEIEQCCREAMEYQFAAVCVPPNFVRSAKQFLEGADVKIATVIGFPFGYSAIEAKIAESILAIVDGANELDIVANISAIKNGDWLYIANEINHLMPVIKSKGVTVKIIIESGVLTEEEIIKCCDIYGAAGIDYLKTSTGYAEKGATVEAVRLFRLHLPAHVQIKASGGIRNYAFARELIDAGATRLGCSASVAIMKGAEGESGY
ncbi:deoxyribose-phosphate aldolase [Sediminibacterium ginsengisoli]|uniref:Deoxyribose-phosphate aldolase n=2 Tax=Sediminibacterium ginsengisoli TaxID=413434 RepID=A0A1T4KAT8_9BACT|nr:deoxyribose-phosphate aldolase [Sediminibacterium ginsengisoli]